MPNHNPTLINICGTSRSGTTMLDLIFGNSFMAFSCGEVRALYRPWRAHHFSVDCSCEQTPCPYWEKIKEYPEEKFHRAIVDLFGVEFVIDSSKHLTWIIDNNRWANKNNMRVFNLVVWKSPVSLAYSFWKRGRGEDFWRKQFLSYYGRLIEIKIPFVSLSFDELTKNPANKIRELCEYIGLEYFQGKENFWEKEHHYLFGSAGVREQLNFNSSEIHKDVSYPDEFLQNIDTLNVSIQNDLLLQSILNILISKEISNIKTAAAPNTESFNIPLTKRPLWYYRDHLVKYYRRRFPVRYDAASSIG